MTSRQAAEKILKGILSLADEMVEDILSMRSVGLTGDADLEEIKMRTLLNVAAALQTVIDEGEFD